MGVRPSGGYLDDAALLRLLDEGLALQHVGEVGGAPAERREGGRERGAGRASAANGRGGGGVRRGLIGLVRAC
jgi:hypothetical protein